MPISQNNEKEKIVTILTPTYNRAQQLPNLWKTLCSQTNQSFEWLIVDDGSTDDTETVVTQMISDNAIDIRLLKKSNGGKHTALNRGIREVTTPLIFIVDSDDVLSDDAIDQICRAYHRYGEDQDICGFSFLRAYPDGKINGKPFCTDELIDTYINVRVNSHDTYSDKAEVYKTECLLEFPFPEYAGERFLGEDVVWIRMARKYKTVHINSAIYIGEYQTDGLTKNRRKHNMTSPKGCTERAIEFLYKDIHLKYRIKGMLQYLIYGKLAGYSYPELYKNSPTKFLFMLLFVIAIVIRKKWEREYMYD